MHIGRYPAHLNFPSEQMAFAEDVVMGIRVNGGTFSTSFTMQFQPFSFMFKLICS